MRRGQTERWQRARELAEQGLHVTAAARQMGMNHASLIYISKQMGFEWVASCRGRSAKRSQETMGHVEKMMRLACK